MSKTLQLLIYQFCIRISYSKQTIDRGKSRRSSTSRVQLRRKLPSGRRAMWLCGLLAARCKQAWSGGGLGGEQQQQQRRRTRKTRWKCLLRADAVDILTFPASANLLLDYSTSIRIWNKENGVDMSALSTERQEYIYCINQPDAG